MNVRKFYSDILIMFIGIGLLFLLIITAEYKFNKKSYCHLEINILNKNKRHFLSPKDIESIIPKSELSHTVA